MAVLLENLERLGPRLRVVCNGDAEVNANRATISAAVSASDAVAKQATQMMQQAVNRPEEAPLKPRKPASMKKAPATDIVRVSCFVQLASVDAKPERIPGRTVRRGSQIIATLTPRAIERLVDRGSDSGIAYVEMGEPLSLPHAPVTPRAAEAPRPRAPKVPRSARPARAPAAEDDGVPKVLIGLVDVGGFDFAHPDFLDRRGCTRFARIWDQGAPAGAPLASSAPNRYGAELTADHMAKALAWSGQHKIAATDLLRQAGQAPGAHATHVASIAAGNRGVCPFAALAGVSIALAEDERSRHKSLYDSTRLAHAIDYLFGLGETLYAPRRVPTVVNISLGTNGHAHDGSSPISQWIDAALMTPGRCVCVAAGNAGQEAPKFVGDLGFLTGRIHAGGQIAARGLETDLEWQVVGNGIADVSENELEIWYEPGDEFEVRVRSPSGVWIGPVAPGEFLENMRLASETFVSIFSERSVPANGANRISVFLSPRLKKPIVGIEAGTWLVRLRGREVRDGRFDAWIERDDPRPLGRIGDVQAWRFPSYFSSRTNVDRSSASSLASGHRVIAVANCDELAERIHSSSSQGPTRDGRRKPEIAAFGTDVVAARGFSAPDRRWMAMTGTSMASPYVAGVAAQMLALEPRLTAMQIAGIMRKTARPLPGSDYRWQDAAGFGRIDPAACLAEVTRPFEPKDLKQKDPRVKR